MKFMLLVYSKESDWTPESKQDCFEKSMAFSDQLKAQGKFLGSSPLQDIATAKSVQIRDGKQLVTSGPFAETTEQLGGFYLIEAADEAEAIEIATQVPPANVGTIEVRPIHELPDHSIFS